MKNTDPLALQLTGGPLRRYLEIRRRRKEKAPLGDEPLRRSEVLALRQKESFGEAGGITPESLEAYARKMFGESKEEGFWLTQDQWEIVILFCHEHLDVREAAYRCKLSQAGIRYRWKRAKRRIRLSPIRAMVNTDRRELIMNH